MSSEAPHGKTRQRFILPVLVAIFAAPFAAAWLVFHYTDVGRHGVGVSHGTLIDPPRPLPDAALYEAATGARAAHLHGKWALVYLAWKECAVECMQALEKMQGLHVAMGKEAHRVQRVLVLYGAAGRISLRLPEIRAGQLLLDGAAIDPYRPGASFRLAEGDEPVRAARIYLVDPLGNLMMSYPGAADAGGMLADLRRLLRYSHIG